MRTFNDITPPSRRKEMEPLTPQPQNNFTNQPPMMRPPERRFPYATLIAIVIVIALSAAALFYFSSARVEITPNTVSAAVQGSFTAAQTGSTLPFQIITAQKMATKEVKGGGTKAVSSIASGMITIYNTQAKAQNLVATTRFATPAGLVYRIKAAVSIPGGTSDKPGSVTARVYADQPGASYNVGPTSFIVPGFAGTPQATAVYAKSFSAMTGGASGTIPTVDTSLQAQTTATLKKALEPELLASLQEQVPAGYVLLSGAATTTFEELTPASSESGMVIIKEQGTATGVVFPNAALAGTIATSVSALNYQGEPLTLAPTNTLTLSATELPDADADSFSFSLSGTAPLIYTVDSSRIAAAVSGKTRSAAEVALTNYPEIRQAIIILRPFWRQSFPQDPSSISVVVNTPE